jgi:dienelactone hydrolase
MFLIIGAAAMLASQAPGQSPPAGATAQLATPAVTETAIAGFPHARLYSLPGTAPRPVIVILPGAEGGDGAGKRFGPMLARMGYAAVSFPYYSPNWGPTMPPPQFPDLAGSFVDIRIDQLVTLRDALAKAPGVDVERIGLFAGSKGAEFALIAASRYPWIDAVAAFAPSDLV